MNSYSTMALATSRMGSGPSVVLVHGDAQLSGLAWFAQHELAERWTVVLVDRASYGASEAIAPGSDYELDAKLLLDVLDEPMHLVGHSGGAIAALLATAKSPSRVRSLTVVEPPAFTERLTPGGPATEFRRDLLAMFSDRTSTDLEWGNRFVARVDPDQDPPPDDALLAVLPSLGCLRNARRTPFELDLPLNDIRRAGVPSMVVSGGQNPAFEDICDRVADELYARREVVKGAGHCVQYTGSPFNCVLEEFLREH